MPRWPWPRLLALSGTGTAFCEVFSILPLGEVRAETAPDQLPSRG